jgi:hypothetical protein
MSIWRRSGRLLLAVVLMAAAASCGTGRGTAPDGDRDQRAPTGATESARTYGYGPVRDRSVTYQPDVVLVEGGPDAIRSASANGLTWTIDGDAAGAADLEPGKVMYVTSRAVGRVVDVTPADGDLAVTLAPVTLTEVFRDAHFVSDRQLDDSALVYQEVPDLPGAVSIPTEPMTPGAVVTPTGFTPGHGAGSDQVEVYVGDGAKKILDIDRELEHEIWPLSGIADEAYAEDGAVFLNKSGQWVAIRLVSLNDPKESRKPLEDLARKVAGANLSAAGGERAEPGYGLSSSV